MFRVICRHASSLVIRKFRLRLSASYSDYHVRDWISDCLKKYVRTEEIDLRMSPNQGFVLPQTLFASQNLKVLKLSGRLGLYLEPASAVCLPNLKILCLVSVRYLPATLTKLLFGCPILEDLFIHRHDNFQIPTSHHYCNDDKKLKIDVPSLQCLKLKDYVSRDFSMGNLSNLVEAHVDVGNLSHHSCDFILKLLKNMENVKFLSLGATTIKSLRNNFASCKYKMPVFHNLTRLAVKLVCCYNCADDVLLNLLENSPCLQFLTIEKGSTGAFEPCRRKTQQRVLEIDTRLFKLTSFEYIGFDDSDEEDLEFLNYI